MKKNKFDPIKTKSEMIQVFLNLGNDYFKDEEFSEVLLNKFELNKKKIGERFKSIKSPGISYYTESVKLYNQAKELFCLGYFESSIIVCRSVAEYLATEIFVEQIDLKDSREKIETIAENLDFRKIVNNFLDDKKNPLIDSKTKKIFNDIYSAGNDWVHPKRKNEKENIEERARHFLDSLTDLMDALRNVLNDLEPINGVLCKKLSSRNYRNGIKLIDK